MAETPVPAVQAARKQSVCVFDCRPQTTVTTEKTVDISDADYKQFLQAVRKVFSLSPLETFVLTTTDRREITADSYNELPDEITLYLLKSVSQQLNVATEERIKYVPHFHTIVQSGQYEYYASEGQKALPYAFAELIDNSLSATSRNSETRRIDIKLFFDESHGGPAVVIMDNGRGMTSKELNNWAVYRLSKFNRDDRTFHSDDAGYTRPNPVPRSLNSDISYFGVGGKQAVFYIGQSVRIISKPVNSLDVHEFVMSKDDFVDKEKNKEEIYSGVIRNRKPADCSHLKDEERFLRTLVLEERDKKSFTTIFITLIQPEHITYLKQDFKSWTRELAHIYHYYIHGFYGNEMKNPRSKDSVSNIDIQISLHERATRQPKLLNLREIEDDMQTLYINSSVSEFEFKAIRGTDAMVDGVIRYHPFLYDKETYPEDPYAITPVPETEEDCVVSHVEGRGKRSIFECYWNGRLIPYSTVDEFDWCARPKKPGAIPLECYNRISGVLFTNDRFQVSTNKLTFMDLDLKLRDNDTIFTKVLNGQDQRVKINQKFTSWLKECHEKYDKQVKFVGFLELTCRTDVSSKKMQSPWAKYKSIQWDGKTYKIGQHIKTQKTQPIMYGSIVNFLLYGDHEEDVFDTGGYVTFALEPKELYNEKKIISISKIDRQASVASIMGSIEDERAKLPDKLRVSWPDENPWPEKAVRPAGTPLGPIKVEILNKKGETLSKLPGSAVNSKKFLIDLKVFKNSTSGDKQINSHVCMHSSKWEYWFKKMENLNDLGKYTIHLQTVLQTDGDNMTSEWAGKRLPHFTLHFTITASSAAEFCINASPLIVQVGVPFTLSLEFKDKFHHPTQPPPDMKPQLECSSLELSYNKMTSKDTVFTIQDLRAKGKIKNHEDKMHTVKVIISDFNKEPPTFQFNLRPGPPRFIMVLPENEVSIENGTSVGFKVEVQDEFQNVTTLPKLNVRCQLNGAPDLPVDTVDCSNSGTGVLLAKPIQLKQVTTEKILTAKFSIPNLKSVSCVERTVRILPSRRVQRVEVYRQEEETGDLMVIQNAERINWTAGDTLDGLHYRLYDEGARPVPLTLNLASNVKVNWSADVNAADLAKGILPSVVVPAKAQFEQFYQVAIQDQHAVETSFIIIPRPDEPERLRVTPSQTTVKMGEIISQDISVEVVDQYGNRTDVLTADTVKTVSVSADDLDKSALNISWQDTTGTALVSGVCFSGGLLGPKELCIKYQDFEAFIRVKVTAGAPAQIILLDAPEMPLPVLNGQGLDMPLLLQLCDKWGNPSPDQRVVISMKAQTTALKVKSSAMSRPVDQEGKASFLLETVTAAKGVYGLGFRGCFSKNSIIGPIVELNVMPNPNKPVSLSVEFDRETTLSAGEIFPVFKVAILSEIDAPVKNLSPANLSMLLWQGKPSGSNPPPGVTALNCSKANDKEDEDHFYFRDKVIPERVGKYVVQFVFVLEKGRSIWSDQIPLNVVANDPVKLMPDAPPLTPVVSNGGDLADRTFFKRLCLQIVDKYDNPAAVGLNGRVILTVISENCETEDLPKIVTKNKNHEYKITNGQTIITDVALMENSPGVDCAEYILQFQPIFDDIKSNTTFPPYTLPFRFSNDAENQKFMAVMSKEKDRLSRSIDGCKSFLETHKQLELELKAQVQDAANKETTLKLELKKNRIDPSVLTDRSAIMNLIDRMSAELEKTEKEPRRKCTIADPYKGSPQVLGKIAHLALVKDDNIAKVISWHLLGDMDCVVTETTVAAKKIYDDTHGRQQVMPLETMPFWKPNTRPLPHIRNGQNLFRPLGDPVFARDLLIFTEYKENCNKVFSVLLGDTILVDDLDSANHYRKLVVQNKVQCPTLLTRQGERIRSNGKFGGLQNKAPSIEKLRGQVFGAPLPDKYHHLCKQKELLQQYLLTSNKTAEVKADYNRVVESPHMKRTEQDLHQQEQELRDIEKKLASTPVRPSGSAVKRNAEDTTPECVSAKRMRGKPKKFQDP